MQETASDPARRGLPTILYVLVGLGILGALFMGGIGLLRCSASRAAERMRVFVRNDTGRELASVVVGVRYTRSAAEVPDVTTRPRLGPGEEFSFRPKGNDVSVSVTYTLDAVVRTLPHVIDLWTGESYRLQIAPDGSLRGGYLHPPR
jgi:hypothetical protein